MGKQAKKKDPKLKGTQKNHNKATRGINTSRRGIVFDSYKRTRRNADGGEEVEDIDIVIPKDMMWNPFDRMRNDPGAPEPFDHLHLDWREELMQMAAEYEGARLGSIPNGDGSFTHRVYVGNNIDSPKQVIIDVVSSSPLILHKAQKRARRKRKVS